MGPIIKKLLGQAVVRTMIGDKREAAELASRARDVYDKERHLFVRIEEILLNKAGDHRCRKTIML